MSPPSESVGHFSGYAFRAGCGCQPYDQQLDFHAFVLFECFDGLPERLQVSLPEFLVRFHIVALAPFVPRLNHHNPVFFRLVADPFQNLLHVPLE